MLPVTCDALLPKAERYASHKFRRLSRSFRPASLNWDEAVELVAFIQFLGGAHFARSIFHWQPHMPAIARGLAFEPVLIEDAAPLLRANLSAATVEDGLLVLGAMQDGGWRKGQLPEIVKMSLREEHHATGISALNQGLKYGLSEDQVQWARTPRRVRADRSLVGLAFG